MCNFQNKQDDVSVCGCDNIDVLTYEPIAQESSFKLADAYGYKDLSGRSDIEGPNKGLSEAGIPEIEQHFSTFIGNNCR